MENIFLSGMRFVSDNRFWIMPVVLLAVTAGIVNVFVTGIGEEK